MRIAGVMWSAAAAPSLGAPGLRESPHKLFLSNNLRLKDSPRPQSNPTHPTPTPTPPGHLHL
jgi:hypothetical protein